MYALIGGSGLYELVKGQQLAIETPYGEANVVLGKLSGKEVAFIARHGKKHAIPPHRVNHRANISALKSCKAKGIIAVGSAGVISKYRPGDIVVVRDFIGLLSQPVTFFDSFEHGMRHTDVSEPYDGKLCEALKKAAKIERISLEDGGVLAGTTGPRFETKAEIKFLKSAGANLVNMTSVAEAVLANEIGIPYANLLVGANYACGISKKPLSSEEVLSTMKKKEGDIKRLLASAIALL